MPERASDVITQINSELQNSKRLFVRQGLWFHVVLGGKPEKSANVRDAARYRALNHVLSSEVLDKIPVWNVDTPAQIVKLLLEKHPKQLKEWSGVRGRFPSESGRMELVEAVTEEIFTEK